MFIVVVLKCGKGYGVVFYVLYGKVKCLFFFQFVLFFNIFNVLQLIVMEIVFLFEFFDFQILDVWRGSDLVGYVIFERSVINCFMSVYWLSEYVKCLVFCCYCYFLQLELFFVVVLIEIRVEVLVMNVNFFSLNFRL